MKFTKTKFKFSKFSKFSDLLYLFLKTVFPQVIPTTD